MVDELAVGVVGVGGAVAAFEAVAAVGEFVVAAVAGGASLVMLVGPPWAQGMQWW